MCITELRIVGRLLVLVISWCSTVHTVYIQPADYALTQIVFVTVGLYCEYTLAKILRQAGLTSFSSACWYCICIVFVFDAPLTERWRWG